MVKYFNRFKAGNHFIVASFNDEPLFYLQENKGFSGGWNVLRLGSSNEKHFNSLDAAKNFIENSLSMVK